MFENTLARFEAQIESIKSGIMVLEYVYYAQRLQVVLEATVILHTGIERILPGVAEGRVAEIVSERYSFHQVFI